jgi:hypothetical protein
LGSLGIIDQRLEATVLLKKQKAIKPQTYAWAGFKLLKARVPLRDANNT